MTDVLAENRIIHRLIDEALTNSYQISVHDGVEFTRSRSTNRTSILSALRTTDSDTLVIRSAEGHRHGSIMLVYGNDGDDVIADHSDNPIINALVEKAETA